MDALTGQQSTALVLLLIVAVAGILVWYFRYKPKDVVAVGPFSMGMGGDAGWKQLLTPDQIATNVSNNITCSMFVYVNADSVKKLPVNMDGSYKMKYVCVIGSTLGIGINAAKQEVVVDVLQTPPTDARTGNMRVREMVEQNSVRTLTVKNVPVSKWNQITVSVEGRSLDVYINGVLSTSAVLDNLPISAFSGILLNQSPDFDGQVALVQIWPMRKTSREVRANYMAQIDTRGKPRVPEQGLSLSGAWDHFCKSTSLCGFRVDVGPLEYVDYEFA
jgi:hypothetical protein